MEKIRCNKSVFTRNSNTDPWEEHQFESINLAKKFNGKDSRTVEKQKMLPPQRIEKKEELPAVG